MYKLLNVIMCFLFGHSFSTLKTYKWMQTEKQICIHCERLFVYKTRGEFAGSRLTWTEEWEKEMEKIEKDIKEMQMWDD